MRGLLELSLVVATAVAPAQEQDVDWATDVAPILHARCVACHRPGQVAPFSLLEYEDARAHARQIARATGKRIMPPWLPDPGFGEFANERRLTDAEIATLERFAELGAPAGDLARAPAPPVFPADWQLGKPDLVVAPLGDYVLAAEGGDVFRTFVVPVELPAGSGPPEGRFVEALELRPNAPQVFHHATILLDPHRDGRRQDARDPEPGFAGMNAGEAANPDGHFLGWSPGRVPKRVPEGMSWRLPPRADLLVSLHLLPSGKPETVRPQIGLWFTDEPPTRRPFLVRLGVRRMVIPAGEANYVVEDRFTLPADVDVLSVFPHAHYLGKQVEVQATLPGGERKWLLKISRWDFAWQDSYELAKPLFLPRGSELQMRFAFDNSADNPKNPSRPPRRVTYGPYSTDEMAETWIQVLPRSEEGRAALDAEFTQKQNRDVMTMFEFAATERPDDAIAQYDFGTALLSAGQLEPAIRQFERALALDPRSAAAHGNLGLALYQRGDLAGSERELRKAIELAPEESAARRNLAMLLHRTARQADAKRELRIVMAQAPDVQVARLLAWILATAPQDDVRDGKEAVRIATMLAGAGKPDAAALDLLAAAYAEAGRFKDAIQESKEALDLATAAGDAALAERIRLRREKYRERQAWRDEGKEGGE